MKRLLGLAAFLPLAVGCDHHDDDDWTDYWYVDALYGSDYYGDGTPAYPYRTITYALDRARSGDVVFVAPGTYSTSIGETFPLYVGSNVTVEGDVGAKGNGTPATLVTGGGSWSPGGGTQAATPVSVAVVLYSGANLRGFVVTNPGGVGVAVDNTSATLEFCTVTGNGSDGVRLHQAGGSTVQNDTISSNTGSGIVSFDSAAPVVRQNSIVNNTVDGVRARDASAPNLASGGNTLQGNGGVGLFHDAGATTLQAAGNTWRLSTQFSTASGTYPGTLPANPITGADPNSAYAAAMNYAIANAAGAIQF